MPKWLKIVVALFALLLLVGAGGAGFLHSQSTSKLDASYPVPTTEIVVPTDDGSLVEGKRLLVSRGCGDCHGKDFGGRLEDMGPVASLWAPNLTSGEGGTVAAMSDTELAGIIRHGVRANGRAVVFMPAHEYWPMPDAEVGKLVAAIRQLPKVDRARQPTSLGPIGHMLNATDQMILVPAAKVDHAAVRPELPPPPAIEYGAFIGKGCTGCHGETYAGGAIPGAPSSMPIPTNITLHQSGLAAYDLKSFISTMRSGKRPNGEELDPFMPFSSYAAMTDDELTAIWKFLESQPKKPFGER